MLGDLVVFFSLSPSGITNVLSSCIKIDVSFNKKSDDGFVIPNSFGLVFGLEITKGFSSSTSTTGLTSAVFGSVTVGGVEMVATVAVAISSKVSNSKPG